MAETKKLDFICPNCGREDSVKMFTDSESEAQYPHILCLDMKCRKETKANGEGEFAIMYRTSDEEDEE
jgi:hypothetical protein